MLILLPPYNLLIGNNDLSNNVLIPNVTFIGKGAEIKDKGELSCEELIKTFQTYRVFIAKIMKKTLIV